MKPYTLHNADNLAVLRSMPDNSVDSIVTDPPYGLSFMGKRWDYDVPSSELWAECLRVLKPGGHLLAFAGTRTQHRMAVRIEDAGFEIRDMIAWVYGSGFPKSKNVALSIDKGEGHPNRGRAIPVASTYQASDVEEEHRLISNPVEAYRARSEQAAPWEGWGTALKPSIETVTFASKPYTVQQERDITMSNLIRLEARLWLLSPANVAENPSTSSRSEYDAACVIAQWSAGEVTSTRVALCDLMGTSQFGSALTTSLSTVLSWRRILEECWGDASMSTTGTASSMTIDWKTLRFSLSQITHESIIRAHSHPSGFSAGASTAEAHFNASLLLLQSTRILSATEPVMSQDRHDCQGAGVSPQLDPCIMARKPFDVTVAENVLTHGTGALNIDGCRVATSDVVTNHARSDASAASKGIYGDSAGQETHQTDGQKLGRWPANLIHDGSEEVVVGFPQTTSNMRLPNGGKIYGRNSLNESATCDTTVRGFSDSGSAARFFYCAKASKSDRDEGCNDVTPQQRDESRKQGDPGGDNPRNRGAQPRVNHHPTVKPTDLMRYLCRLVTPPGGVVLDPFMGSGSTGKAAMLEGFGFIGIEREAEYVAIAERRIAAVCEVRSDKQMSLFGCPL